MHAFPFCFSGTAGRPKQHLPTPARAALCLAGPAPSGPLDLPSLEKNSFRLRQTYNSPKPIISCMRNDHFQNSISTLAMDDPSPDGQTAPQFFQAAKKHHTSAAKCAVIPGPKKHTKQNVLTKRNTLVWFLPFPDFCNP